LNPYTQIIGWMWILWYGYWIFLAFRGGKKTVRRESLGSTLRQRFFLVVGYCLLLVPPRAPWLAIQPVEPMAWMGGVGTAICFLGLAFSVWARVVLGTNWSGNVTLKENHQLIQEGPYAWARHPIYTGILTAALGTTLNADRVGALLGLALVILALHFKMSVEERFMLEQFGPAYKVYALKVKRLIPFVY
jgi:protein-S-isoprenylcysteine O-methyltransferase Ste14